ncbi:SH3 domain-containing protein [Pseudokordiimonas caeni]|uniref:SH3 domain-containing protein n=1 Tax=Pseudokordiimonas caeni TaxID=2997908 RepID=UPI00281179E5|nr:SH3 domain-containing protein [Pseudokordiimonas caeni]
MRPRSLIHSIALAASIASAAAASDYEFASDVIGASEKHLDPAFWIKGKDADTPIMSVDAIAEMNRQTIADDPTMRDLAALPATLSRASLTAYIRGISNPPTVPRIHEDGKPVTDADVKRWEASLALGDVKAQNPVRFGLVVKRASLRTYPTHERIFSEGATDRDIDRFQETGVFPGDEVAVLHTSADGKWYLVANYQYVAWVPVDAIATGNREAVLGYRNDGDFLVVTGAKVHTVFNPEEPRVSELQLDMGVRLPVVPTAERGTELYGQNPYLGYMVRLPVREADGSLAFRKALIARSQDVHMGYLPYTNANIVKQAFKFVGERYGWGHDYNGRDCTGFVGAIYASFGILMPRNSGDQGKSVFAQNTRIDKETGREARLAAARKVQLGDLVYIPGHVMMVLGFDGAEPFVIHDVTGLAYTKADGAFYRGTLNGVSITPLLPLSLSNERLYIDAVYNIKRVRP